MLRDAGTVYLSMAEFWHDMDGHGSLRPADIERRASSAFFLFNGILRELRVAFRSLDLLNCFVAQVMT
jgi:hypothetical protein